MEQENKYKLQNNLALCSCLFLRQMTQKQIVSVGKSDLNEIATSFEWGATESNKHIIYNYY